MDFFFKCSNLESINFPVVESIGMWAFDNCKMLTNVNFGADYAREITFGYAVFGDDNATSIYGPILTPNIELTICKDVLPVPDTNFNTWQDVNGDGTGEPYVWKSIKTYTGIEEKTNEKNIYNLGDNKYKLENIEKAELYDLVGRKIMNINNQELLDLNHLTTGFYFIKYFDKNKILRIEKIIIK